MWQQTSHFTHDTLPERVCMLYGCVRTVVSCRVSVSYRQRVGCLAVVVCFNRLTPNDPYSSRTATLTSIRCILNIYSTNIGTEYFKHGINCPFFPSSKCSLFHNSNVFGSCIIHILYTGCAKNKKNNSGAKILSVFSLQNAVCFIILTYLVPVLFTFYIQGVLK